MLEINWQDIPQNPGCYLWKDKDNKVIYVGKAKNLRNRMKSYFSGVQSSKTAILVKNISGFDYQVTPSEVDALLLEQNLINKYEPKYNIRVKRGRVYPYIEITSGLNKEIKTTAKISNNGSKYYGPFPDGVGSAYRIAKLLRETYPLNKCLNPGKNKPCLNYQLGLCMGQCVKEVKESDYKHILSELNSFFNGNTKPMEKILKQKIEVNSAKLMFEEAAKLNNKLHLLDAIAQKQKIIFKDSKHRDVIGFFSTKDILSITISFIRFGNLLSSANYLLEIIGDKNDLIESFLLNYYQSNLIPDEIILDFDSSLLSKTIKAKFINPIKGIKKELLKNSVLNAELKLKTGKDKMLFEKEKYQKAMKELNEYIHLNNLSTIEMVDISSLGGKDQVGVVVAFKNGNPDKSLYRKYIIDSTDKMDDYQAIYEVTYRHFRQKLLKKLPLPDLFIVDGKHQIQFAKKALIELKLDVSLIGLKKNKHHETEALFTIDQKQFKLQQRSSLYITLGIIQDEVHRFAIKFHNERSTRNILTNSLDQFKFLTKDDQNILFNEFETYRNIKLANEKQLQKVIGLKKAKKLIEMF